LDESDITPHPCANTSEWLRAPGMSATGSDDFLQTETLI
jgi:hypothetical protein